MVSEKDVQTHPTSGRPSLSQRGKITISSPLDNPSTKKKEKVVTSSRSGFDYLTCSQKELGDKILRYVS